MDRATHRFHTPSTVTPLRPFARRRLRSAGKPSTCNQSAAACRYSWNVSQLVRRFRGWFAPGKRPDADRLQLDGVQRFRVAPNQPRDRAARRTGRWFYPLNANPGPQRIAHVTAGGQSLTVAQDGAPPPAPPALTPPPPTPPGASDASACAARIRLSPRRWRPRRRQNPRQGRSRCHRRLHPRRGCRRSQRTERSQCSSANARPSCLLSRPRQSS